MAKNDAGEGLEPIIVTARRQEEDLQRAPISVVTLSASDLEARSLTHLLGLQNFVPNLTFAPSQNVGDASGNLFIRGIGQEDFLAGVEPGVGYYLDGVYVATTIGTLTSLIDIARIEVLRGPQGTLYGKNAIGGAINVISVAPQPTTEGYASLIAGNLGRIELRGAVNAPLTERLFFRISGGRAMHDSYLRRLDPPFPPSPITETNRAPGGRDETTAGRLQLRWLASDLLTVHLAADASRRRGNGAMHLDGIDPRFGNFPAVNRLIREGKLPGPEISNAFITSDLLTSFAGGPNSLAQNVVGVAASVSMKLGSHDLRLITAYRRLRNEVATDPDGFWFALIPVYFAERHWQYSAELLASGALGRFTYTGGVFALRERTRTPPAGGTNRVDVLYLCGCFYTLGNRPRSFTAPRQLNGNSYAAFAQANLALTNGLSITLGGRLSHERKSLDEQLLLLDPDTLEPTQQIVATGANRGRWSSFTWRAGLEFRATPDLMLYASAAKGYKSGGFNIRPVANLPNLGLTRFAPETARTYEAGIRSEWFGSRLRLNATLFHAEYRNIQLRQQTFVEGMVTTLIENAARARVRGLEVEATAKLGPLAAKLAYGHLRPRYLDVGRVPGLTLESTFPRTPRHSLSISFDYSMPLRGGSLALHGDFSYRSREQFQILATPWDQPGYGLVGARLTFRGESERWSFALFGTNLGDVRYRAAGRGTQIREIGVANSIIGLPRQLGVEFKAGF